MIVRSWERADWNSIGLSKPSSDDFFAAVATWVFFNATIPLNTAYVRLIDSTGCWHAEALLLPVPENWFLAMLATDAMFEELATRAYVIERISGFTGSRCLGGIASLVLSVAMHVPGSGGGCGALVHAPMLALLTGLYLWRRSMAACALTHFLLDAELVFGVPFLGHWLNWPHHAALLLVGGGLIYYAVRWRRRAAVLFPAAAEIAEKPAWGPVGARLP
jgi:membrane protease YdiL (CAAX protease family)